MGEGILSFLFGVRVSEFLAVLEGVGGQKNLGGGVVTIKCQGDSWR